MLSTSIECVYTSFFREMFLILDARSFSSPCCDHSMDMLHLHVLYSFPRSPDPVGLPLTGAGGSVSVLSALAVSHRRSSGLVGLEGWADWTWRCSTVRTLHTDGWEGEQLVMCSRHELWDCLHWGGFRCQCMSIFHAWSVWV